VDDEESVRVTLKAILKREGHEIMLAGDVKEAVAKLEDNELDVVVSDIILPGASGIKLLQIIQKINPVIPVIMITGEPNVDTAAEAVRSRAFDYVAKPVKKETILPVVAKAYAFKILTDKARLLEEENRRYQENLEQMVVERTRTLMEREKDLLRLTALLENTSDFVSTSTADLVIMFINGAGKRLTGYDEDTDISEFNIKGLHPKWALSIIENEGIPTAIKEGIWRGETALLHKDGTEIPVSQVIMSHRSPEGELEYLSTIVRDMSIEKKTEEELKKSEEWFRSLIEHGSSVYAVVDAQGKPIYESPSIEKVFGYTVEEAIKKPFFERLHPDDVDEAMKNFKDILENPGQSSSSELRYRHKDGSWRIIEGFAVNHLDNPAIGGIIVTSHDITEKKRAEEVVKVSQERLSSFMNSASDCFYLLDKDLNFIEINQRGLEIIGRPKDEVIGKNMVDIIPEVEGSNRLAEHKKVLKTGEPLQIEQFIPHPRFGDMHFILKSFKVGDGLGIIASDITNLRRVEEEIQNFFKLTPDLMGIMDIDTGKYLKVNPAFSKLSGYPEKELLENPYTEFTHPSFKPLSLEDFEQMLDEDKEYIYLEIPVIHSNGELLWTAWSLRPDFTSGIMYMIGRDISQQKKAEQELMRRVMKYRIEEKNIYLVEEHTVNESVDAFNDLLKLGYFGVVFSREPRLPSLHPGMAELRYHWLSEEGGMRPDCDRIRKELKEIPRKSVIILTGLDHLILKNGFDDTLSMVQGIRDMTYLRDMITIVSIDPRVLEEKEITLLKKECHPLEKMHTTILSQNLHDILAVAFKLESRNIRPSYDNISEEIDISKPTLRKRLGILIAQEYISESQKGKEKHFQLTDKGKNVFSK